VVSGPGLPDDFQRRSGRRDRAARVVLNAQVPASYARMDPAVHVAELATGLGLAGDGVGLLAAAKVTDGVQCEDEEVRAADTVGLRVPAWAAVPPGTADRELAPAWRPGTINIIVSVPCRSATRPTSAPS
jgi:adenosylcobinamide amidohydrolase